MRIPTLPVSRRALLAHAAAGTAALAVGAPRRALAMPSDPVDAFALGQMERYGIPGMSVAIVRDGRVEKLSAYGIASLEFGIPAAVDTVYEIASVTKLATGIAVMLLAEDGRLTPDTPVRDLLPEAPPAWSGIRVHHLLEHTSGLAGRFAANPRYVEENRRREERFVDAAQLERFTAEEMIAYLVEMPPQSEPGTRFSYAQPPYFLVGVIVERLSGMPFAEFLQRRVFQPLGMAATRFGDSRVVVPGRAQCAYTRQFGGVLQNWAWDHGPHHYPAAGLNTTAADFARLFVALHEGRLLRPESLERMWTPARLNDGTLSTYGLGWDTYEVEGRRVVGHEGGGCCWVSHLPAERLTAIALSNLAGARADDTADRIALLALG